MKFYVRGGIGDFLQCSWFICNNKSQEFIVHTHYKQAEDIFRHFGAENSHFYYFDNIEEHDSQVDAIVNNHGENSTKNIRECPRAFYSDIDFSNKAKEIAESACSKFKNSNPIIGIHPFGSSFSANVYSKFNIPLKFLPSELIKNIIRPDYNYIIFGSESELQSYGIEESDNVLLTKFDISTCLELVKKCSSFIGTDSCFKTMSNMNKIPTICVLSDIEDELRDSYFINQYEKDGIMRVFRTLNVEQDKNQIVDLIVDQIYNKNKS